MGLDIALGVVILVAAIRGWLRGFALQIIRLGSLIGCVYLADPVRDLARPYARDYLPGVQPEVLDKLLWWSSAVLGYVVMSGVGTSLVKLYRKKTYEEAESNRGDQGAGFLLGGLKGALVAVFVAAAIQKHAPEYIKAGGWVGEQVQTSQALALTTQYRPAEQIWNAPPVRSFVAHVRNRGLWADEATSIRGEIEEAGEAPAQADATARPVPEGPLPDASRPDKEPVQTASGLPRALSIPPPSRPRLDPRSPAFLDDLDAALGREGLDDGRGETPVDPDRPPGHTARPR